ncbi:DUF202 domain-containing protein [Parapedobacter lycopersici]|uniref:YidH family protein n=1 Tax=Parapedobacter lycopersici TaxID=1864939 RepID=UPI003340890E
MNSNINEEKQQVKQHVNDHLANERTLLAWVRTAIGIMAFGFVVVKFSLFVRQVGLMLGQQMPLPQYGYTAPIGILLVAAGALCLVLALFRYRQTARQLDRGVYAHTSGLLYGMVGLILVIGVLLIGYLIMTT